MNGVSAGERVFRCGNSGKTIVPRFYCVTGADCAAMGVTYMSLHFSALLIIDMFSLDPGESLPMVYLVCPDCLTSILLSACFVVLPD